MIPATIVSMPGTTFAAWIIVSGAIGLFVPVASIRGLVWWERRQGREWRLVCEPVAAPDVDEEFVALVKDVRAGTGRPRDRYTLSKRRGLLEEPNLPQRLGDPMPPDLPDRTIRRLHPDSKDES